LGDAWSVEMPRIVKCANCGQEHTFDAEDLRRYFYLKASRPAETIRGLSVKCDCGRTVAVDFSDLDHLMVSAYFWGILEAAER